MWFQDSMASNNFFILVINSTYISLFPLEFEHLCDWNVCKPLNHLLNLILSHLNLFLWFCVQIVKFLVQCLSYACFQVVAISQITKYQISHKTNTIKVHLMKRVIFHAYCFIECVVLFSSIPNVKLWEDACRADPRIAIPRLIQNVTIGLWWSLEMYNISKKRSKPLFSLHWKCMKVATSWWIY